MRPDRVLESCLYVDDLAAAERFYTEVLGLAVHSRRRGRHVFLRCGDQMVLLFRPEATAADGASVPSHGATGPGHLCFAVADEDLAEWRRRLAARGVEIEQDHRWPGGARSLYFRDPAGNSLELASPRLWETDGA